MKINKGARIRIIADTMKEDPHELPIGSEWIVEDFVPACKFEDLPKEAQFMIRMASEDHRGHDIPDRVHVITGEDWLDYANIPVTDLIVLEGEVTLEEGESLEIKVRMTEDDYFEAFKAGDTFTAWYEEDTHGYVFPDNDGDLREVSEVKYVIVTE